MRKIRNYIEMFFLFLLFNSIHSIAQNLKSGTIKITYDTLANTPMRETLGPIKNDKDSVFIGFDSGFENDSVAIMVNNKVVAAGLMNSKLALGKAGGFRIARKKEMQLTLVVKNKQKKFETVFNKKYCVAHLHLDLTSTKLIWTYTNQVYSYQ
jgi:hypothetical protein